MKKLMDLVKSPKFIVPVVLATLATGAVVAVKRAKAAEDLELEVVTQD